MLLFQRRNEEIASNVENRTLIILWLGAGREYNKKIVLKVINSEQCHLNDGVQGFHSFSQNII